MNIVIYLCLVFGIFNKTIKKFKYLKIKLSFCKNKYSKFEQFTIIEFWDHNVHNHVPKLTLRLMGFWEWSAALS